MAIGVMLCEIGTRIYWRMTVPPNWLPNNALYESPDAFRERWNPSPIYEYHPHLGGIPKAGDSDYGYKINKYHFRYDEDFPVEKPENEIRIFITGGSTAWGMQIDQKRLYSSVMEKLFAKDDHNKKIRVISAGVNGYSSERELYVIKNYIMNLSPDYLVMFSGFNDIDQGCRGNHDLGKDLEGLERYPVRKFNNRVEVQLANRHPRYFGYTMKLHWMFDRTVQKYRYKKWRKKQKKWKEEKEAGSAVKAPMSIPHNLLIDYTLGNVHKINKLAKENHFKLIYYLQPNACITKKSLTGYEATNHWKKVACEGFNKRCSSNYIREANSLLKANLSKDAEEEKYYFIDGDESIRDEKEIVFLDYVHLNDRGNRLVATHMYDELKEIIR